MLASLSAQLNQSSLNSEENPLLSKITRSLEDKFTQFVKNHEEVKWGKVNPLPCIVMQKADGICGLLVQKDRKYYLYSRTGKPLTNCKEVIERATKDMVKPLDNWVAMVEVCNDKLSLEELGGCVNPNRAEPLSEARKEIMRDTYMFVYDLVTLDEFIEGKSLTPFQYRFFAVLRLTPSGLRVKIPNYAVCHKEEEVEAFFQRMVAHGEEGVVRALLNSDWKAGRKDKNKTKRVRGVDYDLEVIGLEFGKAGTKRQGQVNKLIVRWKNTLTGKLVELPVDGRFDDQQREEWHSNPDLIIGKVVHVHALQIGSKGSLRLAKVRAIRVDKTKADI